MFKLISDKTSLPNATFNFTTPSYRITVNASTYHLIMRPTLTILIPTRNRATLAIAAIRSVTTNAGGEGITIIVSDNSTEPSDSSILGQYVGEAGNISLRLIKPPRAMSMTEHWEWALATAIRTTQSSHFCILTDRMLFRPGTLKRLMDLIVLHPHEVISYTYDRIHDYSRPIVYQPLPRSGQLLKLNSRHLLQMSAKMKFKSCLPRMLNSVAPRESLLRLRSRFGTVFDSVSPDYCYCYRTLNVEQSFIFYDKSILLSYAHDRSNGAATARGSESGDHKDFLQTLAKESINRNTLLPDVITVGNAVINEFNFVKQEIGHSAYGEMDWAAYLNFLANEVLRFEDPRARENSLRALREAGWQESRRSLVQKTKDALAHLALRVLSRNFNTLGEAINYALTHEPLTHRIFAILSRDIRRCALVARFN